jgi:hypothetical protein
VIAEKMYPMCQAGWFVPGHGEVRLLSSQSWCSLYDRKSKCRGIFLRSMCASGSAGSSTTSNAKLGAVKSVGIVQVSFWHDQHSELSILQ